MSPSIGTEMAMPPFEGDLGSVIRLTHKKYALKATIFKYIYYSFRIIAGLSACLLPFIVPYSQIFATILAAIVAVVTVLDTIFVPKDKWRLYSLAADKLWVEQVKNSGEYEKYKAQIQEIIETETKEMELLTELQQMLDKIKKQQPEKK